MGSPDDTPYGMRPVRHFQGVDYNAASIEYAIEDGYATSMFAGDLVAKGTSTTGFIVKLAATPVAATPVLGVFLGCRYRDAHGNQVEGQGYIGNSSNTQAYAMVSGDPYQLYRIRADATGSTVNDVGLNAAITVEAGTPALGHSKNALDVSSIDGDRRLGLVIVSIDADPVHQSVGSDYIDYIVKFTTDVHDATIGNANVSGDGSSSTYSHVQVANGTSPIAVHSSYDSLTFNDSVDTLRVGDTSTECVDIIGRDLGGSTSFSKVKVISDAYTWDVKVNTNTAIGVIQTLHSPICVIETAFSTSYLWIQARGSQSAGLRIGNSETGIDLTAEAAGNTQGDRLMYAMINIVTTTDAVPGSAAVTLTPAAEGGYVEVYNESANNLNVFPASGDNVNALATDAAYVMATGVRVVFRAVDGAQWYTLVG